MAIIKKDNASIMVKCSCHSHALEITVDDFGENTVPLIYFGIWTYGQRPLPLRWRDRFRWIYCLIRNGRLHADDVILDEKDALEVSEFLKEKSDEIKQRIQELNERKKV